MKRRIVVTGIGSLTPLGNSSATTWEGICAGKSGIGMITKFDCTGFETRIAGELKNFDPSTFVSRKEARRSDNFILYALAATAMALEDARLTIDESNALATGVIIGSAIGGLATIEQEKSGQLQHGPGKMKPFSIPAVLCNLAAGQVSIKYGAKGPIGCPVTACAAGTNAIGEAARIIERGDATIMIAGGSEAAVCPLAVDGFNAMRAISRRNDEPEKASRPFDLNRDGFIISEGAGIMILEEMSFAIKRGAKIYAELAGFASTADAYHMATPPPGHAGAARCMEMALKDAGMAPTEIDYINAHGTSTPINDAYETEAIKTVFAEHSKKLMVSSTKSMIGHLLGASGAVEAILSVLTIERGIIPPTINLDEPDPECDLDYVPHQARRREINAAMSNSFGFGGANGVLIFKKFTDL